MAHEVVKHNLLLYICLGAYLVVLVVIAVVAYMRKKKASAKGGELDAHFGGSFPAPLLVLTTFSTVFSGFTVTGVPSEAYHDGFLSVRWIGATLVIVLGMLLVYPRIRRLAVVRSYRSPSDFITDRYRSVRLRVVCAVCALLPLLIYMSAQTVSFASMVSGLTGGAISKPASMSFFVFVILALEKLGGMNSVVLTDSVQSVVMIGAFLMIPFVLGADFGFLWDVSSADCPSLTYVSNSSEVGKCAGPDVAGCAASGCLAAVRPEFYEFPTHRAQCSMAFFLLNMIAAPLQPHMIQRAYIASSDRDLKIVMATMLFAPFLAQTPGILMGLTKATFERGWPLAEQQATAFAAVSEQLMACGALEYTLATLLTCSSLAAIMSTADSVLMGASSLVSIDIYKGVVNPEAKPSQVVRLGEINSVVMAITAGVGGLLISVSTFGHLITIQNGLLMQLLPAYVLGLFTGVRERGIVFGIIAGVATLAVLLPLELPWAREGSSSAYVPKVNISVAANFLVVGLCEALFPGAAERPSSFAEAMRERFGDHLRPSTIRGIMRSTREPHVCLLLLMGLLLALSVPLGQQPGSAQRIVLGLPAWAAVSCALYVCALVVGLATVACWAPAGQASGYESSSSASEGFASNEDESNSDLAE
mmetsp:Transcript_93318/g.260929  ORF Transcript_93318/g.260929 Transcript_93318/m.260929 type:complete len:646 (+) Transcript_93318:138-2075(+)